MLSANILNYDGVKYFATKLNLFWFINNFHPYWFQIKFFKHLLFNLAINYLNTSLTKQWISALTQDVLCLFEGIFHKLGSDRLTIRYFEEILLDCFKLSLLSKNLRNVFISQSSKIFVSILYLPDIFKMIQMTMHAKQTKIWLIFDTIVRELLLWMFVTAKNPFSF